MSSDSSSPALASTSRPMSTATFSVMVMLRLYWGALFCATHVPLPHGVLPGNTDKFVHFVAYAGLGMLLMGLRTTRGAFTWGSVFGRWLVLAAFGVFDELTQLLVNRNADFRDWLYDITGAAAGVLLVAFVARNFRPK